MRAGGSCSLQQALTPEAAGLIKQAVTLAKRRGHGQVTPLHVAATMLTVSTGLLRSACLRSHSHPLQCKALELCFNVALNRLPAASSGPMFGIHGMGNSHHHHQHVPSISNALIAAFKRAQAHQRRGSVENNQSLQAVKIELDQLVISILDDPSVSRVMREAGFSSSQVKSNVERVVSSEKSPTSPASAHNTANITPIYNPCRLPPVENESKQFHSNVPSRVNDKDVIQVMEHLMDKRRKSIVIVGESMETIDRAVRGLIDKLRDVSSSVDDVAQTFRGVKFINLSLPSFENLPKDGVKHWLHDLRVHLGSNDTVMSKGEDRDGVILFLGDLKWIAENRGTPEVELLVAELGKLICTSIEDEKFWVMGTATLQSYMRCKSGYPSLESIWRLYPVAVPAGSLSFGLSTADSDVGCHYSVKIGESGSSMSSPGGWLQPLRIGNRRQSDEGLTCCVDCHTEFKKEAQNSRNSSANGSPTTSTSSLPPWLQQYKDEQNGRFSHSTDDRESARDALLIKKWNSICNSLHGHLRSSERSMKFSSLPSSPSTSGFSCELINPNSHRADQTTRTGIITAGWGTDLDPSLSRSTSSLPNSGSSSDDIMEIEPLQRFKESNPKNMKILIDELKQCVPWQKHLVPDIVNTIFRCRSRTIRWSSNETWFLFEGADNEGKEKMASELARLLFSSYDSLIAISSSLGSRGSRDPERSCTFFEELAEAVSNNPHRVFFIKDIEVSDHNSQAQFMKAIENRKLDKHYGHEVDPRDAIIILSSCRSLPMSTPREQSPIKPVPGHEDEDVENPSLSLDLNISIAPNKNSFELRGYVDKVVVFDVQEL